MHPLKLGSFSKPLESFDTSVSLGLPLSRSKAFAHNLAISEEDLRGVHLRQSSSTGISSRDNFHLLRGLADLELRSHSISDGLHHKLFLRLFEGVLGELSDPKDEWTEQVLEGLHDFVESTVFEDSSEYSLKDVTENLWGLKRFDLPLVEVEIGAHKRKVQVVFNILLGEVLLLEIIVDDVLVQSQQDNQLRQEFVLHELDLCLMGIRTLEVLQEFVLICRIFVIEIPLKECESKQVRVG